MLRTLPQVTILNFAALYETMKHKEGILEESESGEFGTRVLREKLKRRVASCEYRYVSLTWATDATVKADQVFIPVLENASKASKVRSTLSVFDRSKFFFNLPGALAEYIEQVSCLRFLYHSCRLLVMHRASTRLRCATIRRASFCSSRGRDSCSQTPTPPRTMPRRTWTANSAVSSTKSGLQLRRS